MSFTHSWQDFQGNVDEFDAAELEANYFNLRVEFQNTVCLICADFEHLSFDHNRRRDVVCVY